MRLDTILFRLGEPEKTMRLREFLEEDHEGDGKVLLKPASGKPFSVRWQGKQLDFAAQGRRVPRRLAIDLLLAFGEQGLYRWRDQATGFTRVEWTNLAPEMRRLYDESQLRFLEDYLTHVPDGDEAEEAVPAGAVEEKPIRVR